MAQIALIVVVLIIVVGAVIRATSATFRAILKPPLRIQLVPVDDRAKGRFADYHRRELESLGFTPIGIYDVREMPGVTLVAFTQASESVCAVVYRHPIAGVFSDVICVTEERRSLTVTNAPAGANLDHQPGHDKVYMVKASMKQLYDRLMEQRPSGPYKRIDSSNFMRVFEDAYAREMEWRKSRGGPTRDEVRREAHAMGIHSEKTIEKAADKLRGRYREPTHPGVR
jgi:hypothetical protein